MQWKEASAQRHRVERRRGDICPRETRSQGRLRENWTSGARGGDDVADFLDTRSVGMFKFFHAIAMNRDTVGCRLNNEEKVGCSR